MYVYMYIYIYIYIIYYVSIYVCMYIYILYMFYEETRKECRHYELGAFCSTKVYL